MKRIFKIFSAAIIAVLITYLCVCVYFVNYALKPTGNKAFNKQEQLNRMSDKYPHISHWLDSISSEIKDTFLINNEGLKLHAYYLKSDVSSNRTAFIIHGYQSNAISMLHIGYMYHHDLHYNIFLPDLQCHGTSEGDEVQMGWKDKDDVKLWLPIANNVFGGKTQMVVHGISMGGATTMMLSGEQLPSYVNCFVDDCGYTSVWDEFKMQANDQFGIPAFPILNTASFINKIWHGWSFTEASAIKQVTKCKKPMLFIHGGNDDYVPTEMVYPLYKAKAEPKELYISKGSAHATSYLDNPTAYTHVVKSFVDKYN